MRYHFKTMKAVFFTFCLSFMILYSLPSLSQQEAGTLEQRTALAEKMHVIRPLDLQIERSIGQLAERYPPDVRAKFVRKMNEVFNKEEIEKVSVKAMAETFSVTELEAMVAYYGSDEGQSAQEKMIVYQSLVQPELRRKIDQALMQLRTGALE